MEIYISWTTSKWRDFSNDEIINFLAILILLGINNRNSLLENWTVNEWERSIAFNFVSEKSSK